MVKYVVSKHEKGWSIVKEQPGWITPIAKHYRSLREAVTVARVLAGWSGKVVIR